MRPNDLDHAVVRGAGREETEIVAVPVHQEDEGGVVDVGDRWVRRLGLRVIDLVGAGYIAISLALPVSPISRG